MSKSLCCLSKLRTCTSKSLQLSQLPLVNAWPVASQWFGIPCLLNANALERRKKLHVNVCHAVQGWHLGPACLLNSTARLLKWPSSTPRSAHCCLQPCQYSQEQAPTRTLHNHQQQQGALQFPSSSLLKALLEGRLARDKCHADETLPSVLPITGLSRQAR